MVKEPLIFGKRLATGIHVSDGYCFSSGSFTYDPVDNRLLKQSMYSGCRGGGKYFEDEFTQWDDLGRPTATIRSPVIYDVSQKTVSYPNHNFGYQYLNSGMTYSQNELTVYDEYSFERGSPFFNTTVDFGTSNKKICLPDLFISVSQQNTIYKGDGSALANFGRNADLPMEFAVTNRGIKNTLEIKDINITGSQANGFYLMQAVKLPVIPPGQTWIFSITLKPTASPGYKDAVLNILSNDSEMSPLRINLQGSVRYAPPITALATRSSNGKGCVISAGQVFCWDPINGEINNIPSLNNPIDVAFNSNHACAVDSTGLHCWNSAEPFKELTPLDPMTPRPVLFSPTKVVMSDSHMCVLDTPGVSCWGRNDCGQVSGPPLSAPTQIAVGWNVSCAIDSTGLKCWGQTPAIPATTNPIQVSISADGKIICALDSTGVKCSVTGTDPYGIQNIPTLSSPTQISVGPINACAIDSGAVKCWGAGITGINNPPALVSPSIIGGNGCAADTTGLVCWPSSGRGIP